MECTIITYGGRDELMYGIQKLTGVDNPRFYEVPETMIDELRECPVSDVQSIISKIKSLCREI